MGLTFSVYDSSVPIPEDGKGKAEIEVFEVSPNVSAARVLNSSVNNPIVQQDIVANLIWDSQSSNNFVVVGEFDLNGDGINDKDGNTKVRELIQRWGGKIQDAVTIETDFVILGDRASEGRSSRRPNRSSPTRQPSSDTRRPWRMRRHTTKS